MNDDLMSELSEQAIQNHSEQGNHWQTTLWNGNTEKQLNQTSLRLINEGHIKKKFVIRNSYTILKIFLIGLHKLCSRSQQIFHKG